MILECCGCERIFFRRDYWFSEWEMIVDNPYTGKPQMEGGVETTYWPAPVKRKKPEWIDDIAKADKTLGKLLFEMYAALNNDLRVLAAIGARTAFDRSSELLKIDAALTFKGKLDELVAIGKVSKDERAILEVLVDAGNAAAHRGWTPKSTELSTMMTIVEAFLHRAFILGDGIQKLKAAVPPKPTRQKEAKRVPSPKWKRVPSDNIWSIGSMSLAGLTLKAWGFPTLPHENGFPTKGVRIVPVCSETILFLTL
jgi:hypothetical protein